MKSGKRFHTFFANQERRTIQRAQSALAAIAPLYAAEPDVIAGLLAVAHDLQYPAAPLDHHARTVWIIQAGRRVASLAARIQTLEPPTKRLAANEPIPRRFTDARAWVRRPRAAKRAPGQLEMHV